MEFYIVKDCVQVFELDCVMHTGSVSEFSFDFPVVVKPVDQSKSARHFIGCVRDAMGKLYMDPRSSESSTFHIFENRRDYDTHETIRIFFGDSDDDKYGKRFGLDTIFGLKNFKIWVDLSVCDLATEDSPVCPENLITLDEGNFRKEKDNQGYDIYYKKCPKFAGDLQRIWEYETNFVYTKLTIEVEVNEDGVKRLMETKKEQNSILDLTRKMLKEELYSDLEIRCNDGGIVKCHRAVLSGRSKAFQAMFQAEGEGETKIWKLELLEMNEKIVNAFLGWIYWNDDEDALSESDVAVELSIAGNKYDLEGLVENMMEIMLNRRGYDEEWFSVKSAVKLFGWARDLEKMKVLREKAMAVLKFFGKTFPEKLVESNEYQHLIKSDADAAMELSPEN